MSQNPNVPKDYLTELLKREVKSFAAKQEAPDNHPKFDDLKALKEDLQAFSKELSHLNTAMANEQAQDIARIVGENKEAAAILKIANRGKVYQDKLETQIAKFERATTKLNDFAERDGNGNHSTTANGLKTSIHTAAAVIPPIIDTIEALENAITVPQQAEALRKGMWNKVGELLHAGEEGSRPLSNDAREFLDRTVAHDAELRANFQNGEKLMQHLISKVEDMFIRANEIAGTSHARSR